VGNGRNDTVQYVVKQDVDTVLAGFQGGGTGFPGGGTVFQGGGTGFQTVTLISQPTSFVETFAMKNGISVPPDEHKHFAAVFLPYLIRTHTTYLTASLGSYNAAPNERSLPGLMPGYEMFPDGVKARINSAGPEFQWNITFTLTIQGTFQLTVPELGINESGTATG
jgi:hypothetical protein